MFDRTSQKVLLLVSMVLVISSAGVLVWQDRALGQGGQAAGLTEGGSVESLVMMPFVVAP